MVTKQAQRVFITGSTGCIGKQLANHLLAKGFSVYGLQRKPADANSGSVIDNKYVAIGNILDNDALGTALSDIRPTQIYHLAGAIDKDIQEGLINYETNILGTIRLLNAVRTVGITPQILIVSSSAVYGAASRQPIAETSELLPLTHYAVSKVAQEMVALQYHLTYQLPIVRVRNFNVVGPGLAPSLLCSDLARQIALAEKTGERSIHIGNILPRRDYTDVRDIVRAYELLMQAGKPGEVYNVCSMKAHSVQECLETLLTKARVPVSVIIDKSRYRAAEIEIQVGDSTKLSKLTDWKPEISFTQSLEDLLNSWRDKLQGDNE